MTRTELDRIISALEKAHETTQATTNKPADTVNAFASAVGLDTAAYCIAAMVRRVRFDGRISRYAKAWADGLEGLDMPIDWMQAVQECYSPAIHPAHLSQLAEAMQERLKQPDPEGSQEEPQEEADPYMIQDIFAAAVSVLPASDIDHHATDLYLRKTPISSGLVERYRFRCNVTTFCATDGSGMWYDVPFAYTPEWERHAAFVSSIRGGEWAKLAAPIISYARASLEEEKQRSAWNRGVSAYALEMLDCIEADISAGYFAPADLCDPSALEKAILNGASDWGQYSWGGCSLCYDSDIAARLCTPSELKRTHNGERRPNSREEWLDTQARALSQAARRVKHHIAAAVKEAQA